MKKTSNILWGILLIVAGVVLDTVNQVQSYLVAKQYSGVIKKTQKKGRFRG